METTTTYLQTLNIWNKKLNVRTNDWIISPSPFFISGLDKTFADTYYNGLFLSCWDTRVTLLGTLNWQLVSLLFGILYIIYRYSFSLECLYLTTKACVYCVLFWKPISREHSQVWRDLRERTRIWLNRKTLKDHFIAFLELCIKSTNGAWTVPLIW